MGGVSLLAASLVVALLGFGWINAIKEGVFDVWAFISGDKTEEAIDDKMEELERDDAEHQGAADGEDISVDPEFNDELNELESELDDLLKESEDELNALEGEL